MCLLRLDGNDARSDEQNTFTSPNQQTPSAQWPDMVVVQSKATINYAVQFPSEKILGDYLPPAEGALAGGAPPMYILVAMKPSGQHTFNRMCAFIIAHLAIFSPGAGLPKWIEILENTPKDVIAVCGYQYNLQGELKPVPASSTTTGIFRRLRCGSKARRGTCCPPYSSCPGRTAESCCSEGNCRLKGVPRVSRFSRRSFGFAVRREREKLGVSQEAFAEQADLHRTYISSIERGKVNIGIEVANGIATALV